MVICIDEFGPLNRSPTPASNGPRQLSERASPAVRRGRRRRRATYKRPHGVRHLLAGYDLSTDRLYGHVKTRKSRTESLQFTGLRYFALDGTDHESHREQASMIRGYIAWRNRHVTDP